MVGTSSAPNSLKEYLKKYTTSDDMEKKKKKKKKVKPNVGGVLVVDEDPVWQKPIKADEEDEDSVDEEKPQVNEDIEVKRMKRLEQLRLKRPVGVISEDGSGWISVSDTPSAIKSDDLISDISPPRNRRLRNDTPSPRQQDDNDLAGCDLSPPRHPRRHNNRSPPTSEPKEAFDRGRNFSPPRRKQREKHSSMDSDISPPRRARRDFGNQDDSRASSAADLSPPRKNKNERSSSVVSSRNSIHRLGGNNKVDVAPSVSDLSSPRRKRKESPNTSHRPKTGLVTGRDVKAEIDKTKKEDMLRFNALDPSVSGREAKPVYRDSKTGVRISEEDYHDSQKKKRKKDEKPKEIKVEWGTGLAQKREGEARLHEMEVEKNKPFARSRDDPELDSMMKERVRWGDPMAHLVKKKHLDSVLPDLGDNERMKESGFIVPQEVPSHSWMRRGLEAAPNRYGIKPGRHWDGVDRSTGYEKDRQQITTTADVPRLRHNLVRNIPPATIPLRFRCFSTFCRRLPSDQLFLSASLAVTTSSLYHGISLPQPVWSRHRNSTKPHRPLLDPRKHRQRSPFHRREHHRPGRLQKHRLQCRHGRDVRAPVVTLPCTAKYKVIRTVAAYDGPLTMWRHSIITLGASLWSDYRNIPLLKQLWNSKSVCINGTLYLIRFCLRNNAVLDAFTIKEESWYGVSYPAGLSPSRYDECHLID